MRKCRKTLSQPSRIFTDQGLKAFFRVSNVGTLPWCTPRQAMRRLASRRAKRDGAQTLRTQLQPPDPTQKTVPAPIGTVFLHAALATADYRSHVTSPESAPREQAGTLQPREK